MAEGKIDLKNFKANYQVNEPRLVDVRDIHLANEVRLYYEIFFGIGLTLLPIMIMSFSWIWFVVTVITLILGLFFLIRYILKSKDLNKENKTQ